MGKRFDRYRIIRDKAFRRFLPDAATKYPLECLLAIWCPITAASGLLGYPPRSLSMLPEFVIVLWAVLAGCSGIFLAVGLKTRLYGTVMARGLYLFAAVLIAFGLAGFANAEVRSIGGPGFLTIMGIFAWARAWRLRSDEEALAAEYHRRNGGEDAPAHP